MAVTGRASSITIGQIKHVDLAVVIKKRKLSPELPKYNNYFCFVVIVVVLKNVNVCEHCCLLLLTCAQTLVLIGLSCWETLIIHKTD